MKRILLTSVCLAALGAAPGASAWPTALLGSPPALVESLEPLDSGNAVTDPATTQDAQTVPDIAPVTPPPEPPATPTSNTAPVSRRLEGKRLAERASRNGEDADHAVEVQYGERLQGIVKRGSAAEGRSLVIRSGDTDPKNIASSEEDLAVMSRILNKSLGKKGGDEHQQVMGVTLLSGGDGIHNFLIDGYGAIFLLRANIPLVGAPAKVAEEKPKEPTNSTWDEAKQELYGTPHHSTLHARTTKTEFDPKRVDELKDALLEAMKNASNIRNLKENEFVTVVVSSGDDGNVFTWRTFGSGGGAFAPMTVTGLGGGGGGSGGSGGGGGTGGFGGGGGSGSGNQPAEVHVNGTGAVTVASGNGSYSYSTAPHVAVYGGSSDDGRAGKTTTLTIRVKKSDVDSFFKGKINLEEFRKKAAISIY